MSFFNFIKKERMRVAAGLSDATQPIIGEAGVIVGGQGSDHSKSRAANLATTLCVPVVSPEAPLDDHVGPLLYLGQRKSNP